jgi:hypothetical protein
VKEPVYRIQRVVTFATRIHADVCDDARLSILAAARMEVDRMDYREALALREAALALQAMIETRLLVVVDESGGV